MKIKNKNIKLGIFIEIALVIPIIITQYHVINILKFSIQGRRPRGAVGGGGGGGVTASVPQSSVTTTEQCCDSPKRKEQRTGTPSKNYILRTVLARDPESRKNTMNLRGSKTKISSYFQHQQQHQHQQQKINPIDTFMQTISNDNDSNNKKDIIDLTDDATCDEMIVTTNNNPFKNVPMNFLGVINNTENIFLQEPVLSLNIDKSPTQASSIIIKKTFDACHNFGASISMNRTSSASTNSSNDYYSLTDTNGSVSPPSPLDLSKPTQVTQIDSTTFLNSDSNSNDSGVVIEKAGNCCDKKPVTPHRILWVSPKKSLIEKSTTEYSQRIIHFENKNIKSKKK